MAWTTEIKAKYGTVLNYICQERLHWIPPFEIRSPIPFENPADYKILRNDWPYGLTPDITHIVVWLKTPIPIDPETGDLTDESRKRINDFVTRVFARKLRDGQNRVLWFKNWAALQSVRTIEHVHVLVENVEEDILTEWTGE